MREKFARFMMGRYGVDQFSKFLAIFTIVLMVLGLFIHPAIYYLGIAGMIYMYFRMFSKNYAKRRAENDWYLKRTYTIRNWYEKQKRMFKLRKTHKVFKCPTCKQKIKVPKGRGKIEIRCTKCSTKFIKRS